MIKNIFRVAGLITILLVASCASYEGGTYKPMQDDFDKIRLKDLIWMYDVVEEYKERKGGYPFESESLEFPIAVVFESKSQAKYHKGNYPLFIDLDSRISENGKVSKAEKLNRRSMEELYSELEPVLERKLRSKFDPQKVPTQKPCIYVYTIFRGVFDVSVFTHNEFSFSRRISPYNNKITITSFNRDNPPMFVWTKNTIDKNSDFNQLIESPLNKQGYDRKLEKDNQQI